MCCRAHCGGNAHPFDLDLVANEDSSAVEIAGSVGGFPPLILGIPVYNFAVARVRYRALSTPAANVRVFFRLFHASTTSTDFQPSTTYAAGGTGATKIPLLGIVNGEVVTIPCFAAPRVDPTNPQGLNAQTDPDNVGPVGEAIPPDGSGVEVQAYFGCWLDINQTTAVLPASPASAAGPFTPTQSVQDAIRGKHQCLVAEINLDPPEPQIATGATPATSDKLAQRNLTVIGVASPRQVPQTFDIKPTAASLPAGQAPDELMIDWGNVPAGSKASIYLPGTSGQTILSMADSASEVAAPDLIEWRRVTGTFQVTIPVETKQSLLGPESRLLSVLRWAFRSTPKRADGPSAAASGKSRNSPNAPGASGCASPCGSHTTSRTARSRSSSASRRRRSATENYSLNCADRHLTAAGTPSVATISRNLWPNSVVVA